MSYSTLGRPRKLTDEQVRTILFWAKLPRNARPKRAELAESLGVAVRTVRCCIEREGRYKKAEPV